MRYWSGTTPQELHAISLRIQRVTVWCGVSSVHVCGPYLFQDDSGDLVSVNSDRYEQMLNNFSLHLSIDTDSVWFQQNGATVHAAQTQWMC